jgi:hypothetical protein
VKLPSLEVKKVVNSKRIVLPKGTYNIVKNNKKGITTDSVSVEGDTGSVYYNCSAGEWEYDAN